MMCKCIRKRLAGTHAVGDIFEYSLKSFIALATTQDFKRSQNWQAGFEQRKELLIEDNKGLKLELGGRAAREQTGLRLNRINEIAKLGKALLRLGGVRCAMDLFTDVATFVGQLDDEFCH